MLEVDSQFSRKLYALYKQPADIQPEPEGGTGAGKPTEKAKKQNAGNATIASSVTFSSGSNLSQLSPQLKQKMKQPEFRQKVEELKKQFRQQIEAALAPQQLATLKKLRA